MFTEINMRKVVNFKLLMKKFGGDSVWEFKERLQKLTLWDIFWFCNIILLNDFDWLRIARNPKLLPEIQFEPNYGTKPKYAPLWYLQSSSMPSWSHAILTDFSACMQTSLLDKSIQEYKHERIQYCNITHFAVEC